MTQKKARTGGRRTSAQTSIVGKQQTTISGKGPGWYREPRRHSEAARKGWQGRQRDQVGRMGRIDQPTSSTPRPPATKNRKEAEKPAPPKGRYDDLRAPPSDATLPKYVGWKSSDNRVAPNMEDWEIEEGFIVSGPRYSDHKRSKNWLAGIEVDPTAPGGLRRDFVDRGRGSFMYRNSLDIGDPYEVGADYYTSGGNQQKHREYGVIIEKHGDTVKTVRFETPEEAIKFSRALKAAIDFAETQI